MPACPSEQCQNETSTCSAVPRSWAEDSRSFGSPPPLGRGTGRTHYSSVFFLLPPPSKKWPSGQQKDIRNIRLGGKLNFSKRLIFYGRRFLTGRPWPRSTSGGKSPPSEVKGKYSATKVIPIQVVPWNCQCVRDFSWENLSPQEFHSASVGQEIGLNYRKVKLWVGVPERGTAGGEVELSDRISVIELSLVGCQGFKVFYFILFSFYFWNGIQHPQRGCGWWWLNFKFFGGFWIGEQTF